MIKIIPALTTAFTFLWLSLLLYTILAYFWIRKSMKRKYADHLKKQELALLRDDLQKKDEENRKLKEENERLSSIIHKDNKLLPAMLLVTKELTFKVTEEESPEKRKAACEDIRLQLEGASADRAELIRSYEHSGNRLPATGNGRIDSLLAYMEQRAFTEKIIFEVTRNPDFMHAVSLRIGTEDLSTLLADLLENAVIATKNQETRRILLSLQLSSFRPVLAVYDTGVPFPEEVKAAWGKQRLTTHADSGGSGIGMMSAYEICKKTQAEFHIEEDPPGDFTKCISVNF